MVGNRCVCVFGFIKKTSQLDLIATEMTRKCVYLVFIIKIHPICFTKAHFIKEKTAFKHEVKIKMHFKCNFDQNTLKLFLPEKIQVNSVLECILPAKA